MVKQEVEKLLYLYLFFNNILKTMGGNYFTDNNNIDDEKGIYDYACIYV